MARRGTVSSLDQMLLFPTESDWHSPVVLPDLRQLKQIAVDLETKDDGLAAGRGPAWHSKAGYICGVSVAWHADEINGAYFPIRHPDSECFPAEQVRQWLDDHIKAGVRFIFHNAPYDIGWLNAELDIAPPPLLDDTGCMSYMVDENRLSYGLDDLCKWRKLAPKDEVLLRLAAADHGLDPKSSIHLLAARYVGPYAEQDAKSTLLLAESLNPLIDEEDVRKSYQLEIDLVPMVHAMRKRGIRIDQDAMERAYVRFKEQSRLALQELSNKLGSIVAIDNIRSNGWLEKIFQQQNISYPRTEKGNASFEAKWMKDHEHWLPRLIVRAKNREEAAEKFIYGYIKDYLHKGRLHASVNQFKSEHGGGTRTYRFSYSDPPLQQMPHRDEEMSAEIRGCFLPEEGEEWLSSDYSGQEYRLFVHFAAMLKLPKADIIAQRYVENPKTDFHQWVADITGLQRKPAKDANFGVIYGAGLRKFALMTKKTLEEAERILKIYHQEIPFARQLANYYMAVAENRGYINLIDGARIRFNFWTVRDARADDCPRKEAERRITDPGHAWHRQSLVRSRCHTALNSLIQGSAARQTKIAMRNAWRAGYTPLLQVHDELCFSIADHQQAEDIGALMSEAVPLCVPMLVDLETGPNWHHV